jgi:hypothetical protein
MGFFGHLVASRSAPPSSVSDVELEPGPWRVPVWRTSDRLGAGWEAYQAWAELLAAEVPGGFLSASVLDSDGALLQIGVPGEDVGWAWLQLDGFVSQVLPPWAPLDEDGQLLPAAEAAAQQAEWDQYAADYAAQLREVAMQGDAAAQMCRRWAHASGLEPASAHDVGEVLGSHSVLVEETFGRLLSVLGASSAG